MCRPPTNRNELMHTLGTGPGDIITRPALHLLKVGIVEGEKTLSKQRERKRLTISQIPYIITALWAGFADICRIRFWKRRGKAKIAAGGHGHCDKTEGWVEASYCYPVACRSVPFQSKNIPANQVEGNRDYIMTADRSGDLKWFMPSIPNM